MREENTIDDQPVNIAVLLLEDFSMMAFSCFIEPFRALNRLQSQQCFQWKFLSEKGGPVTASNGAKLIVDYGLDDQMESDLGFQMICVCSGVNVGFYSSERILGWLREQAIKGPIVGGISTATFVLAKAGLLNGYRCTTHWEGLDSLKESYPDLEVTDGLFEIDQQRFTCAGGTAAMDLALFWIGEKFGASSKAAVSDQFIHGVGREAAEPQKINPVGRYGVYNEKLLAVIDLMEDNLEEPLIRQELADRVGVTTRQLERLFAKHLNISPLNFYLQLRLERARFLLRQTAMPISEVAIACGFINFSHFARSYRVQYERAPREERLPE